MSDLSYTAIASLDGYVADEGGDFEWAAPDAEVHSFVNELQRGVGTYLYGRRMYEVMRFWETAEAIAGLSAAERDYTEIWRSAQKIVYSTTLSATPAGAPDATPTETSTGMPTGTAAGTSAGTPTGTPTATTPGTGGWISTARTRLEREFDIDAIRRLKESESQEISIGGPRLASQAIRSGLVDQFHLFLNPVLVGGGIRALPDGVTLNLELLDEHRFRNGVIYLHYRLAAALFSEF
jgi:dihydrofolate reductase